jgi:hypothetical protein
VTADEIPVFPEEGGFLWSVYVNDDHARVLFTSKADGEKLAIDWDREELHEFFRRGEEATRSASIDDTPKRRWRWPWWGVGVPRFRSGSVDD